MWKLHYILLVLIFISCSKDESQIESFKCQIFFEKGSSFKLCDKFGETIEYLYFENDTIINGTTRYYSDMNKYYFSFFNIEKSFKHKQIKVNDLNFTIINDSLEWIDSKSSNSNFFCENIECFINGSNYDIKFSGEKKRYAFVYSFNYYMIQINANLKITIIK